jgi:DNA-binding CsgD family transcriptional regulator
MRSAYLAAAVEGDLDGAAARAGLGGSLWAAVTRAHVLLHGDGDLDAAHRLLVGALEAAGPGAEPAALAAALDTLHAACRFADRPALWPPYRAAAARLAAHPPDPGGDLEAVRLGWALLDADDVQRCAPALGRALDGGPPGAAINAAVLLAFDAFGAGRWDEAVRLARRGQELGTAHGHETLAALARAVPALVAAGRGDAATCDDHAAAMTGWAAPRGARLVRHHAAHARVLAALGRGDAETAYHHAAGVSGPGVVAADGHGRRLVLDLVEAAVRTRRDDEARAHVRAAREAGLADVSARSALLVAGAAALTEQGDRARARYAEALAVPGSGAWPFDVARVRLAYGEHLRRSRATSAARVQLVDALATFRGLGAGPWVVRAESELRAAGHRVVRAGSAAPTALSHQERTVAHLAATGATNRQIGERLGLSPRTVGSHLARVFHKLGVTSRAGLGEALRAADPTGGQGV